MGAAVIRAALRTLAAWLRPSRLAAATPATTLVFDHEGMTFRSEPL
jgi:hypothetical protein